MHYDLVSWNLLVFLISSVTAVLDKRDTDPSLETLIIPLTLDNTSRYSVDVGMSPGPDQQSFSFVLTTGTGYSVVAGVGCNDCQGVSSYNANLSTTVKQLPDVQNMSLVGTNASGSLVEENCQLTQTNGSVWPYPNQTYLFSPGISGVFGLGTNGRNGDFSATVYSGWLTRNPGNTNFTFGMMLNPPWNSGTDGGVLHWQSPDTASYEGNVVWKSMLNSNSTSLQTDWFITMDSLSFESGGNVNISQSGELTTAVDPFESALIFPQAIAGAIYGGIADTSLLPSLTTATNKWAIPCDTKMSLTLTFGPLSVPMDETILVLQNGNSCIGIIEEWSDPQADEYYLLGSSFISQLYIIFSVSGSSQGGVGFAHRTSSPKKLSAGQVSGIVLGSVAFASLFALILFLYYRHQRKRRERELPFPFISPPVSPNHQTSLNEDRVRMAVDFTSSPSFDYNEFGIRLPHDDSHEVTVALSSSVHTPLRPNQIPVVSSLNLETPPPYHQSITNTESPQPLPAQKSEVTIQTDIVLA
ncbi:aspartic peptidase domain-containing protein [Lentinula lateritia]|uniref:Aspartic peptidase domain-containing protein n=1 Tax=Lentinula lateritia TaxID=40482 RepID=A0ABQ8VSJ9_9AGAR|nr:aspartic peptidase domain-containing protein [Lentinula lateritia]